MRRLAALLVAAAVGAFTLLNTSCHEPAPTGTSRHAVRAGTPAPDEAAAVAISLRGVACEDGPGAVVCSGTLVSSRLVLTAGHCAEPYARGRIEVWTGASLESPDLDRRVISSISVHPEYTETTSAFDAALLLLDSPLDAPLWPVPPTPMDATWVGRTVRVLGFGETGDTAGLTAGERRSGTAVITAVDEFTFTLAPDPALTCRGDSGGPVLADIDGVPHLVGVTSAGDKECIEQSVAARVDTLLPGFLDVALAAAPPDDPPIPLEQTCSSPCTADLDCPADLVCAEDGSGAARCLLPGLEPAHLGPSCEDAAACGEAPCVALGPTCRCHTPCDPTTDPAPERRRLLRGRPRLRRRDRSSFTFRIHVVLFRRRARRRPRAPPPHAALAREQIEGTTGLRPAQWCYAAAMTPSFPAAPRVAALFGLCALASCGARSSLFEDDASLAGTGGTTDTTGTSPAGGGGGEGGSGLPPCHLVPASPPSIPLHSFPEGNADTSMLAVIDPGDAQAPSGPRPARLASQAISQDANFWHPELRVAGLTVGADWPDGLVVDPPPTLAGFDAHSGGRTAVGADGKVAVLWFHGDEAAGLPTGLQIRTIDAESWANGPATFVDPEGSSAHALRPGKLDGTPDGPDGFVAAWSSYAAVSAVEPNVAVLDGDGAIVMGPFAVPGADFYPRAYADVLWTGATHLVAVGAMQCPDFGPPCVSSAMNILRIVPPSGDSAGGVELVSSIPFVNATGEARRPSFARTTKGVWLTWSEIEPEDQTAPRYQRLARLDPSGIPAGPPELLAEGLDVVTAMTSSATDTDLLIAWGELAKPDSNPGSPGYARIVLHHRDAEGLPLDPPLSIDTTSFANNPSISLVGLRHPHAMLVAWSSLAEDGAKSITYLSRLDCSE